ncbi:MAG: GNAT family N-acetyltransferase [Gammaproteobacteria bacterium]|nr:GNAT family N-acetyltransferase [Gammaproteobacteria bacterium]
MSFVASNIAVKEVKNSKSSTRFSVRLAENSEEIEQCLRLRYRIFAQEMGARLSSNDKGLDKDRFDEFCKHLMVFDKDSGKIIATTRLLTSKDAKKSGYFYSETEFDLELILNQPGQFMEVGRTCIDAKSRKGAVLAMLWQGIAEIVIKHKIDFLIGCASISLRDGDDYINSIMHVLRKKHFSSNDHRVRPLVPLRMKKQTADESVSVPTLLKGYLRQGAMICGEPHWDAEFNVADVFVLLSCENISDNYLRHFFQRV